MSKSLPFALILVAIGCLLVMHTLLLLNDFLCCRLTLFFDYARYSNQILPVVLSGLAAALFIGFGFWSFAEINTSELTELLKSCCFQAVLMK